MDGVIAWEETTEIPLMSVLMLMLVWHVRRGAGRWRPSPSWRSGTSGGPRSGSGSSRMTSHEMRTPATIASGTSTCCSARAGAGAARGPPGGPRGARRLVLSTDRLVRML